MSLVDAFKAVLDQSFSYSQTEEKLVNSGQKGKVWTSRMLCQLLAKCSSS